MKNLFKASVLFLILCINATLCIGKDKSGQPSEILLSKNWMVQASSKIGQDAKELSTPKAETKDWYKATVPSTIMGVLTDNGLYKDLFIGDNYKKADKTPFDVSWWYRTSFKVGAVKKEEYVSLEFDGLTYRANIWLNGEIIATKDNVYGPFCRFSFDITKYLKEENVLAVEVFRAQIGEPNIGFVDWNPRPLDENMGIFREVRVIKTGSVNIKNTWVSSKVNTQSLQEAWLKVETTLENKSSKDVNGKLNGQIESRSFSIPISLKANETKTIKLEANDFKELHIKNPRLWWSHDMGNPEMYELDLKFIADDQVSDQEKIDFGIRQIETYQTAQGHKGFMLNGKKVLIKSAGWTDDIFLRDTPKSNKTQAQYVKDMNLNSIRFENIWGNSQDIYNLCDQLGLLAVVGWSCQWEWEVYLGVPHDDFGSIKSEHDMKLLTRFLHDQVLWLRNHPSVIAWMGGSDKLPRPDLERMYMEIYPELDDRPYLGAAKGLVSEISGATGMKMLGPYEHVAPNYWFLDTKNGGAYGFNTETGPGPQLPIQESIKKMFPKDKLWPLNEMWNYHCTTAPDILNSLDVLNAAIDGSFGKTDNLKEYLDRAHLLNYNSTKSMFEAFRLNKPEATGVVQWMLNSAWPSLYWQLYDYYQIPVPAYYGVKQANQPQQLVFNYKDDSIYAINEVQAGKNITATVEVYDIASKLLFKKTFQLKMKADDVQKVCKIDNSATNSFIFLSLSDSEGKPLSSNFYCISKKHDVNDWDNTTWVGTPIKEYANFKALNNMPKSKLDVTRIHKSDKGIELELENKSSSIAFFTQYLLKNENGEIIYPVFWEDNYVSILPGEKKILKCGFDKAMVNYQPETIQISGWNLETQSISIK